MELDDLTITDGYVGTFGKTWHTPSAAELERAIEGAMRIEGKTREAIVRILEAGVSVRWRESPNYYYDHSYGLLKRQQDQPRPPTEKLVRCDCGHTIPASQRMSASLGSSCPDCYDRMSD